MSVAVSIAETTTTGRRPALDCTIRETRLNAEWSSTDEPPNFITTDRGLIFSMKPFSTKKTLRAKSRAEGRQLRIPTGSLAVFYVEQVSLNRHAQTVNITDLMFTIARAAESSRGMSL